MKWCSDIVTFGMNDVIDDDMKVKNGIVLMHVRGGSGEGEGRNGIESLKDEWWTSMCGVGSIRIELVNWEDC
jgi:hypothetical protein